MRNNKKLKKVKDLVEWEIKTTSDACKWAGPVFVNNADNIVHHYECNHVNNFVCLCCSKNCPIIITGN